MRREKSACAPERGAGANAHNRLALTINCVIYSHISPFEIHHCPQQNAGWCCPEGSDRSGSVQCSR